MGIWQSAATDAAALEADCWTRFRSASSLDRSDEEGRRWIAAHDHLSKVVGCRVSSLLDCVFRCAKIYGGASIQGKWELLDVLFPEKLVYEEEAGKARFRTHRKSELIALTGAKSHKMQDASLRLETGVLSGSPGRTVFEPSVAQRMAGIRDYMQRHAA